MRRPVVPIALSLVLALLATAPARADEAAERARHHDAEGVKYFNLGEFSKAAEHYKKAYEAKPIPAFLHNIGQCYKRMAALENLERALFYFESYLHNAPDAANRADVEADIAELKQQIAKLRRSTVTRQPATAPPAAAGQASRPAPAPPPAIGAALAPEPGLPRVARSTPIYERWWFWTAIGVAVVGGTVAVLAATTGGDDWRPSGIDGEFTPSTFGNQ